MSKRKAFNFYGSYWEQIKLLNDKQQLDLFKSVCSVQFLDVNIEDIVFKDNITNIVWAGMKHSIMKSLDGFITRNKSLGKDIITPLAKGGCEAPCQQEKEKEQEEEQEQEKEKEKYRKIDNLILYVDEYEKLKEKYSTKQIEDILNVIENRTDNHKRKSLYLTANNWLKNNIKTDVKQSKVEGTIFNSPIL